MTDNQWTRLSALVPDALELPPTERGAFLDTECRDDAGTLDDALLREAYALIEAAEAADKGEVFRSPLDRIVPDLADGTGLLFQAPPETVGPWRVTGVLGEGGMGVVYRASRADGAFERQVALKLLAPGVGGRRGSQLAARLGEERRVLGTLEHEGIARLYDGGLDDDGRPYLAMELVEGRPCRLQFHPRSRWQPPQSCSTAPVTGTTPRSET